MEVKGKAPEVRFQYRIVTWRHDVPQSTYDSPTFTGVDVADCDRQAIAHFEQIIVKPENEWDGMELKRIDTPAVAEKTTSLMRNGKQEGGDY